MNQFYSALENSEFRNHRIPVMLRKSRRMIPAVFDEFALVGENGKSLFRSLLILYGLFLYDRKQVRQLILGIPTFRMKQDAFHHYRIFLTMVVARQPHYAAFIHAIGIPMELLYQLLLNRAEALNFGVFDEPVGVQRLPCFDNH